MGILTNFPEMGRYLGKSSHFLGKIEQNLGQNCGGGAPNEVGGGLEKN